MMVYKPKFRSQKTSVESYHTANNYYLPYDRMSVKINCFPSGFQKRNCGKININLFLAFCTQKCLKKIEMSFRSDAVRIPGK